MSRALQIARKGLYSTAPNPRVGCVLVKNARIVGEGWHVRAGEPHAEILALQQAGEQAAGATAYITLEPCSHAGKTPPCADALVAAGISEVIAAMKDPNPLVAGEGLTRLKQAGVVVSVGLLEEQARTINPGFYQRMTRGLPWVRAKMASSLDGRTAMESGESQWITGPAARADVQRWRARSDAIITGVETVLHDDPALTLRFAEMGLPEADLIGERQPLRVVVDSQLRTSPQAKLFATAGAVLIATTCKDVNRQHALQEAGAEVIELQGTDGRVDLGALLRLLAERQCNEVLVESGATLAGQFLQQQLLDELVIYLAPKLLGSRARPMFDLPLIKMTDQQSLNIVDWRVVGDDWRILATPDYQK